MANRAPTKGFDPTLLRGTEALKLANDNPNVIDVRSKTLRGDLQLQLARAGVALPDYVVKHSDSGAATVTQDVALEDVHFHVMSVRDLVRTSDLSADAKRSWGVGVVIGNRVVRDHLAAADTILHRAKDFPSEPARAGLLPADLATLQAARDALDAADRTQTQKRGAAPLSTRERNDAARMVKLLTDRVSAVGAAGTPKGTPLHDAFKALAAPTPSRKTAPGSS